MLSYFTKNDILYAKTQGKSVRVGKSVRKVVCVKLRRGSLKHLCMREWICIWRCLYVIWYVDYFRDQLSC